MMMMMNNNNNNNNNNKNAVFFHFLSIKESWKTMYHGFHKNIMQHICFSTLVILIHVSWAPTQHIRMISEGSCDTKDWSNDAEISALSSQE